MYSKRNDICATIIHFSDCEGKDEYVDPKLFELLGENDILLSIRGIQFEPAAV
jgi:hypothetical protein